MWKTLGISCALLAALVAWDRSLEAEAALERAESARIGPFVPHAKRDAILEAGVAGISVRNALGDFQYARAGGAWRCLTAHGAPAEERGILDVVNALLNASGVVQSTSRERSPALGFEPRTQVGLRLHGRGMLSESGDVLLDVEVGHSIAGGQGCYVRAAGGERLWAIDTDLRPWLAPSGLEGLPPLLDRGLIPAFWVQAAEGYREVRVRRRSGLEEEQYSLTVSDVPRTEDELERGLPPWEWKLTSGRDVLALNPLRIWGYLRFFASVPYRGVLDPKAYETRLQGAPRARLEIVPEQGQPLVLSAFDRDPSGGYPVHSSLTGTLYLVGLEVHDLLFPAAETLTRADGSSPWEPYLVKDPLTTPR